MSWDTLNASILLPAFAAGLLVLLTHVPLGIQVLDRGIVFIDQAIAQVAGVGGAAADALGWGPDGGGGRAAPSGAGPGGAVHLRLPGKPSRQCPGAPAGG